MKDQVQTSELERRAFVVESLSIERRDNASPKIVGHAAVFNREANIGGMFTEMILPGAFKRSLAEDDVVALFNHDPNIVLGRNRAGTLSLSEDEIGLKIEVTPPDTQAARDLMASIERRDISGMSFGFGIVDRKNDQRWDESTGKLKRTLVQVKLFDVSPVTFPAYTSTDVGLRSLEAYRKENPAKMPVPNEVKDSWRAARQDIVEKMVSKDK